MTTGQEGWGRAECPHCGASAGLLRCLQCHESVCHGHRGYHMTVCWPSLRTAKEVTDANAG